MLGSTQLNMMAMNHVNCALMAVGKMIQESLFVTTAPTAPIQEGKDQLIPMNVVREHPQYYMYY